LKEGQCVSFKYTNQTGAMQQIKTTIYDVTHYNLNQASLIKSCQCIYLFNDFRR